MFPYSVGIIGVESSESDVQNDIADLTCDIAMEMTKQGVPVTCNEVDIDGGGVGSGTVNAKWPC